MVVNIYKTGKKELIGTYSVKSIYDPRFYFRNMPALSARQCGEILNAISPYLRIESEKLIFENAQTGYTGIQELYRSGTILNF